MHPHRLAAGALLFSGGAALVYQLVWTRLLGFAFGTTSEAIGTVLAVFFGGLALGNALAARGLARVERPLRVYALLELSIGAFALVSLPLLTAMPGLVALVAGRAGGPAWDVLRLVAAAAVLLPPTVAMGATLPVVARGVVSDDATLGRTSGILYGANTLGAVLGAYLAGFWLIPGLGLRATVLLAAGANLAVAAAIGAVAGRRRVPPATEAERSPAPSGNLGPRASAEPLGPLARHAFLVCFGLSGFVAIGYEMVWSKLFGIVMEGTLYGFATVLSAYLLGIGAGSLAIAPIVDRVARPARAFGLLHVGIAAAVAAGMAAVPWLPWLHARLQAAAGPGDPTHWLYLVVAPVVGLPAALFGAAFPLLMRIHARSARAAGEGMGRALAVNTAGSIAASLGLGFWANHTLGMDATLFGLLLLDLAVALGVLLFLQPGAPRERAGAAGMAVATLALVSVSYGGVRLDHAVAARRVVGGEADADRLASPGAYRERLAGELARQRLVLEGRNSIVTVSETDTGRTLRTNGMPEAGIQLAPPYRPPTTFLLGVAPYLLSGAPRHALVVGLGGGNTVHALLRTPLRRIEVVELEAAVVEAAEVLHEGRRSPLEDPRVEVVVNDGRNELLRRSRGGERLDLIASQPSHPWLVGSANLFTVEYFELARANLAESGVFALWVDGHRTDGASLLAVIAGFDRVFPGGLVLDVSPHRDGRALLLLGGHAPLVLDVAEIARRMGTPGLREELALHRIASPEDLLARVHGTTDDFASLAPTANTDDNAFVETRMPRRAGGGRLDFGALAARLPETAPLLPPLRGDVDWAALGAQLAASGDAPRLRRLRADPRVGLDPVDLAVLDARAALRDPGREPAAVASLRALAAAQPERAEPLRVLGDHLAGVRRDFAAAAEAFEAAWERSGDVRDLVDAARSLDWVDPEAAAGLADRIPAADRGRFPRLAVIEARTALREGRRGESLRPLLVRLAAHRNTEEGRALPGLPGLVAALADAAGEPWAAAVHREVDRAERARRAAPYAEAARRALAEGELARAAQALAEARRLLPGEPGLAELAARIAAARADRAGLEAALVELRSLATSLDRAVARENRLRHELGLDLLPDGPAEALMARRPLAP